jgi:hypothetical protein
MTPDDARDRRRIEVKSVALDWYRDSSGHDLTVVDGISIGSVLSCILWQGMSSIRHYASLYSSMEAATPVHLPSDASRMRKFVASHFASTVCDLPPTGELHLDEQYVKLPMLDVPQSAAMIRCLQRFLVQLVRRRRHLYITDWVTARSSRRDPHGLVLYRKSVLKSAIPAHTRAEVADAESLFPDSLTDVFTSDRLRTCLARNEFEWSEAECDLIVKYASLIYDEVRPSLVRALAQYRNMIRFYRPKRVFLPADAFEPWIILYLLCRASGIETNMYIDGYMPLPLWPALRNESGDDWIVDRVAAYGSAQSDHIRAVGFPPDRIDMVRPPFLDYLDGRDEIVDQFDAIVLTWIPYTVNPDADYSSPVSTLETTLEVLRDAGLSNIAVKVKAAAERSYVSRIAARVGVEVTILGGRFYEHVRRAHLIIGGISTAIAESAAVGVVYIVFEPYENGYTDSMINESAILSRESICRSQSELLTAINERRSSWLGDARESLFA